MCHAINSGSRPPVLNTHCPSLNPLCRRNGAAEKSTHHTTNNTNHAKDGQSELRSVSHISTWVTSVRIATDSVIHMVRKKSKVLNGSVRYTKLTELLTIVETRVPTRLRPMRVEKLHGIKLSYVSRIEFIAHELSNFACSRITGFTVRQKYV